MFARSRFAVFAFMAVGACASSDPWPPISLSPRSSGGATTSTLGRSQPTRVASLIDGPADAYMMAVAYKGTTEVGRWSGPIDWFRETPASFTLQRAGKRWTWSRQDVRSLRVHAPNREKGGISVRQWATGIKANRVSIVVVDHPGEPDEDAGTEGLGVSDKGHGYRRAQTARTARTRGPDTQSLDTLDIGEGDPMVGQGEFGQGEGEGEGQGTARGRGSSDIGTRTGSEHGSESPSWYQNPLSDIAEHGARTPADHGKAGGSAAGQRGSSGHVGGAGWLNWIDIPVKLSGAAAIVAIVLSGDISGIANRVFQKAVRGLLRKEIRDEVTATARKVAQNRQRQAAAKSELRANADRMSAEQLKYALANIDQSLELATYAGMQKHARQEANRYRAILAKNAESTGEAAAHTKKLATENLTAWRHIEDVAGEQARKMQKAARPPDSVAKQPYDPHKWRAELEAGNPGKVKSSTVPNPKRPNVRRRGQGHHKTGIPYDSRGFPIFDDVAMYDTRLARKVWHGTSREVHMRAATRELRDAIRSGRIPASKFDAAQLKAINASKPRIPGYEWHHHQHHGRMQLIPSRYHKLSAHVGGYKLWQGN